MNSSFLYHAWGLYSLECTREEYKGNTIILHVQSKKRQKECPKCGKCNLIKNGYRTRDFLGLPIGGKKIIIRMKVQRYKCKCDGCDYDQQENAVKKGHVYKTIVVDLVSDRIIYVGEGKEIDALSDFWRLVKRKNISQKYIATDLSTAFIGSVLENCPNAIHVFDHFHVMK